LKHEKNYSNIYIYRERERERENTEKRRGENVIVGEEKKKVGSWISSPKFI